MKRNWFEVDDNGFRALQAGKPKAYIVRELIQNSFDEDVTYVKILTSLNHRTAEISVEDDGFGFRDIRDAYTLFANTEKRSNPEKRGRFNIGEKQAFIVCKKAIVETTSGTVIFDERGRHKNHQKRECGTKVTVWFTTVRGEIEEIQKYIDLIIPPREGVTFTHNQHQRTRSTPFKTFITPLPTEFFVNRQMKGTIRKTEVELFLPTNKLTYLYEMGIPVMEIECDYHVNVLQRIPLGIDRDRVKKSYMKTLFSEILNNTIEEISEENVSGAWVCAGMSDDRISKKAVDRVIKIRYGEKAVVATPSDRTSVDDAISDGANVIWSRELSKEEWKQVRKHDVLKSSKERYGHATAPTYSVAPSEEMWRVGELAKKIMKDVFNIDIDVRFIRGRIRESASYGNRTLTFTVNKLGNKWFEEINVKVIDLIIHELAHEFGMHTERGYHEALSKLGSELIFKVKEDPKYLSNYSVEKVREIDVIWDSCLEDPDLQE